MAETYTDSDGDVWLRKGGGIDYRQDEPDTWMEVRAGRVGRRHKWGWKYTGGNDPIIPQALAAWAALMAPKEPERPETWTDADGDVWRRFGDGITYAPDQAGLQPIKVKVDGSHTWSFNPAGLRGGWSPGHWASAEQAWQVLIGDLLPLPTEQESPVTQTPSTLAPAIHWSFRATMLSYDGPRVRREVESAGGDPESILLRLKRTNRTYRGQPLWRFAVTAEQLKP